MCPNFDTLLYYENNISPFERWNNFKTDSPFTIGAKVFFTCKNLYFVNDEVKAGCPKLGRKPIKLAWQQSRLKTEDYVYVYLLFM